MRRSTTLSLFMLALVAAAAELRAQAPAGHADQARHAGHGEHAMYQLELGGGWRLHGMAQLFPMLTTAFGPDAGPAVEGTEFYANQPAIMFNISSPASGLVLRTTLNFEGVTLPDGELTFGAWGEGFIDRRHPHTLLHEAVLSFNMPDVAGGALSLFGGRGFAPYGTDDPMGRPAVKYPTNHHLSQVLERWLVGAAFERGRWSVEASVFAGNEPTEPYDFSNYEGFGNSWSARLIHRLGGTGHMAPWELSASFASVTEQHHDGDHTTELVNAYVRHARSYGFGRLYTLLEASLGMPRDEDEEDLYSILGEAQLTRGPHQPYVRLEFATRPEYARDGLPGQDDFFRYDHDLRPFGATQWFIATGGYGFQATTLPFSIRPFVELNYHNVVNHRGNLAAQELYGSNHIFTFSAGARLFLGGGPMRMGMYGIRDPMTDHAGRQDAQHGPAGDHRHH
jgi:hypothetical protein